MSSMQEHATVIMEKWLQLQAQERLIIISNDDFAQETQALENAAKRCGGEVVVALVSKDKNELDAELAALQLAQYHAIIAAPKYSILTTAAIKEAVKKGSRVLSLPLQSTSKSLLESRLFNMDPDKARRNYDLLAQWIYKATTIRIKSHSGTDLTLVKDRYAPNLYNGECKYPYTASSTAFELALATNSSKTHGVVVVDMSLGYLGVPEESVRMRIERGRIVDIQDNPTGRKVMEYLAHFQDPMMYNIGELGIGLNYFSSCNGASYIEDESTYGTWHLGFGRNLTFGGVLNASAHFDFVMSPCSMWADDIQIISNGIILHQESEDTQ